MSQTKSTRVSPKELNQWIAKEFNSHFHEINSDWTNNFYYVSTSNNKNVEDYIKSKYASCKLENKISFTI
uniref:Uncharacterized protein n=1 Tax=viral metagenome TaxID=1070528 RepID=A0A6C0E6Z4_9ZZZZ